MRFVLCSAFCIICSAFDIICSVFCITVRLEIFGSVIFSVNRERRCSVERNFRYRAHCLFEGVANVR